MTPRTHSDEGAGDLNLQQLYLLAKGWISDLDFYEDEIRFFKNVLKKYFSDVKGEFAHNRIQQIQDGLFQLEIERFSLRTETIKHVETLELVLGDMISWEEILKDRHTNLEAKLIELSESFRSFKIQLFRATEDVI